MSFWSNNSCIPSHRSLLAISSKALQRKKLRQISIFFVLSNTTSKALQYSWRTKRHTIGCWWGGWRLLWRGSVCVNGVGRLWRGFWASFCNGAAQWNLQKTLTHVLVQHQCSLICRAWPLSNIGFLIIMSMLGTLPHIGLKKVFVRW